MSEGVGASRPCNDEYRSETVQDDPSGCADDKQADFVDFSRYLAHIIFLAGSSVVSSCFHVHENKKPGRSLILSCAKIAYASKLATQFSAQLSARLTGFI